jgi:Domain of unknown function (DUF4386)
MKESLMNLAPTILSSDGQSFGNEPSRRTRWATAILLTLVSLLSFAPVAILAPAIGWPASLGEPATVQLRAIFAKASEVRLGYSVYLIYSIAIAPAFITLAAITLRRAHVGWLVAVAAFVSLSALARSIGITRWLTTMPELASAHAKADPTSMKTIELIFDSLTKYGGGIGEILGVSLFMALAVATLCSAWIQKASVPRWLAISGFVVAAFLFALFVPTLGVAAFMPVAIAVSALSLWMLVVAVWLVLTKTQLA